MSSSSPSSHARRPTLQAVARLAQVSRSTASLILNGRAAELRIPTATCRKVREAAGALGYEANYFARGLRGKGTQTIACIWDFSGPLREDNLVRGMTERALGQGYIAHFFSPHGRDEEGLLWLLEELAHRQMEGVILRSTAALMHRPETIRALERFNAAVVVGCDWLPRTRDAVAHSSRSALEAATAHLRAGGRRALGLIGIPAQTEAVAREVWERAGCSVPLSAPLAAAGDPVRQVRRWLTETLRATPLDALICHSDVDAFIAINELRRLGRGVPEEVAVIGFDNSPAAACFFPPLAGIAQRQEAVADAAVSLLLSRLEDREQPARSVCVEMEFLPRASADSVAPRLLKGDLSSVHSSVTNAI